MRTRFSIAQLIQRGYCLGDIDHMVNQGFASYGSKSGVTVLNIQDIHGVDDYFNEMAEEKKRYRR